MLRRHRLQKLADMVDDDASRPGPHLRFALREIAAVELQLDVPADLLHARGDAVEPLPRDRRARQHVEARAANAALG